MNRVIEFNAWLPEIGYMMEDVSFGHGQIGFPSDDEDFKNHLISKGFNPDECEIPSWLYDTGEDWYYITEPSKFVLLEYTGLKDINDKMIFEGHIVKWAFDWDFKPSYLGEPKARIFKKDTPKHKHHRVGKVEWEGGNLAHYVINPTRFNLDNSWLIEVVGDIFQNPELLINEK